MGLFATCMSQRFAPAPQGSSVLLVEDEPHSRRTRVEKIEKILACVPPENVTTPAG
jgi:hypothetical protein